MNRFLKTIGLALLASSVRAETGDIDGNTDWPATPTSYTVVCLPANYKTDPLSQDIIKGFTTDETLKELRTRSKVWTYDANHPDYKFRWASRISELPTVIVMDGDKVLYKRSKANSQTLASEIKGGGFLNRIRPCPGPNCPNPDFTPDEPDDNRPNRPDRPSIPDRPLIPDTLPTEPIPDTTPVVPPQPDPLVVKLEADIKVLIARIEKLESQPKPKDGTNGKDGAPGAPGVNGTNGTNGKNGADAVIDYTALIGKLPPITFERLDQNGKVLDSIDVHLGKKAKFPPLTVNYLNDSGKVLDTEYVPIGGKLDLHISVAKP